MCLLEVQSFPGGKVPQVCQQINEVRLWFVAAPREFAVVSLGHLSTKSALRVMRLVWALNILAFVWRYMAAAAVRAVVVAYLGLWPNQSVKPSVAY